MFVLSSPSGAGKTTLSRMLIAERRAANVGVGDDAADAARRSRGQRLYFVDQLRFDSMIANGELLEWATVFDNRYGTPRAPVEAALAAGKDVLFDIDWQGTQQLRSRAERRCQRVHSAAVGGDLEKRLHTRARIRRSHPRPDEEGGRRNEPLGRL